MNKQINLILIIKWQGVGLNNHINS